MLIIYTYLLSGIGYKRSFVTEQYFTVDGRNPAPVDTYLFSDSSEGFYTSELVSRISEPSTVAQLFLSNWAFGEASKSKSRQCVITWSVLENKMDVSENSGTPKSSIFNRVFHYKPSILGYHYFRKHPDLTISAFSYYKSARQCDVSWRQSIDLTTRMELNLDRHIKRVHTVNNQFQDVGNKHKALVHLVKICNSCKTGHVLPYVWKQPHMSPKSRCQSMKHESWKLIGMLWFKISYVYAFNYAKMKTKSANLRACRFESYWLWKGSFRGREPSFLVASEANALKLESKPNKK